MKKEYPNAVRFPETKGYFGIGIENAKHTQNIGTIWRSAQIMDADFIFVIGKHYQRMKTDTMAAYKHIPLFYFETFQDFYRSLPKESRLIGIELDENSIPVSEFTHPKQAVYLLGSEFSGLTEEAKQKCETIVQLPGKWSMNVSVAGSIIMYDRLMKNTFTA
ncbi:RNA methyltransferase [Chryseobacterium lacus]|uniref:RNA methyltransferase n=1 Tax=Chryseobacterium lacus TaxID=2058346 RepID=UPI000F85D427|nr:RNA methyltransferase [Chryseobacterium lacus]RST27611.1 TrmH family RNA methyltransferase [Chryseobacterium lacus]